MSSEFWSRQNHFQAGRHIAGNAGTLAQTHLHVAFSGKARHQMAAGRRSQKGWMAH